MVFAYPVPQISEIEKYNASYFASAHGGNVDSIYAKAFFEAIAQIRMKYISEVCDLSFRNSLRILEVGPGKGYLSREVLSINKNIIYDVIETDTTCYQQLNSIGVSIKEYSQLGTYDLIIISHVLEHTYCPRNFLMKYTALLDSSGHLFLEVPCSDWVHKPKDEPHILFFEKKTMQTLLKSVGIKIIDIGYYGNGIESLINPTFWMKISPNLINLIVRLRLTKFISLFLKGLDFIATDIQRVMVFSSGAHVRKEGPAWWIRAVIKVDN
jgi:2-polyprenyl-3-methyl-5-hydroxy-6-metoxy-1,4-benzoquinol methylase